MNIQRLAFGSSIDHCGVLRRCVHAFGESEGYDADFIPVLELAVHEAFVNAVTHANGSDPELPVTVLLQAGRNDGASYLQVEVNDCGRGFPVDRLADFRRAENTRNVSGRGLALISRRTESVRVEPRNGGSVLILRYIAV